MKFKTLEIINFRNFQHTEIELSNKNVIFGMNDSGKTNMLYALRYLFDRRIRSKGFAVNDYFENNLDEPIKITIKIDVSDSHTEDNEDSQFLISKLKQARNSEENKDTIIIHLEGIYDELESVGIPELYWGCDENNLIKIPSGSYRTELDNVFEAIYIPPTTNLKIQYNKNKNLLFKQEKLTDEDKAIEANIETNIESLNENIARLSKIKSAEKKLTDYYNMFRKEDINIKIESEISITGYQNNLVPYIRLSDVDPNNYPTAGDGRKKILSFALDRLISDSSDNYKIRVYLIEEPENHLHRSLQLSLSRQIFRENLYEYLFMTTHSPNLLIQMNNTQLIRIWKDPVSHGSSFLYKLDPEFKTMQLKLNKEISEAVFCSTVLLVEGPSEKILYESILNEINPHFEIDGKYVISVNGIGFKHYIEIFKKLSINYFIKTDNDIRVHKNDLSTEIEALGVNRIIEYLNEDRIERISKNNFVDTKEERLLLQKELYDEHQDLIKKAQQHQIYLSEVDLENDLYDILPDNIKSDYDNDQMKFVKKLQKAKQDNMIEFIKNDLESEDLRLLGDKLDIIIEFINYNNRS